MTRRAIAAALLTVVASTGAAIAAHAQEAQEKRRVPDLSKLSKTSFSLTELRRIFKGFEVAPVDLDLKGKNIALVGLGSYIVNAQGGCNDCHTNPPYAEGGDPFLGQPKQVNTEGYLAGGAPFGPVLLSRNLTPDEDGRPAGLTLGQFFRVMRRGIDFKNLPPHAPSEEQDLLQVMPWPVYGDMIERDLRAMYEYLKAIPSRPGFPRE
jgi:hypothetical protein